MSRTKSKAAETTDTAGERTMNVESVKLSEISPDPSNVRKHSDRNIEAIVASLRAFGQQKPIIVDRRGIILAGNGTYEAVKRLGWETIQIVRTELDGSQAALYAIADNRTAELAEWDMIALQAQLVSFRDEKLDLTLTGWNDVELAGLLPDDSPDLGELSGSASSEATGPNASGNEEGDYQPSHVRMVQLFLDVDTLPEFTEMVTALGEFYQTENSTDTVMESLRREHNRNCAETD